MPEGRGGLICLNNMIRLVKISRRFLLSHLEILIKEKMIQREQGIVDGMGGDTISQIIALEQALEMISLSG